MPPAAPPAKNKKKKCPLNTQYHCSQLEKDTGSKYPCGSKQLASTFTRCVQKTKAYVWKYVGRRRPSGDELILLKSDMVKDNVQLSAAELNRIVASNTNLNDATQYYVNVNNRYYKLLPGIEEIKNRCCEAEESVKLRNAAYNMWNAKSEQFIANVTKQKRPRKNTALFWKRFRIILDAHMDLADVDKRHKGFWKGADSDASKCTDEIQRVINQRFRNISAETKEGVAGAPASVNKPTSECAGAPKDELSMQIKTPKIDCTNEPPALDPWQLAAAVPCLVRNEMLVVADTGTGKSFVWATIARLIYETPSYTNSRIVIFVLDKTQAYNQYNELLKSPAWHDKVCDGSVQKEVSVYEKRSSRRIWIITYAQAANEIKGKTRTLDNACCIMDEVEFLWTGRTSPPYFKEELDMLRQWFTTRKYAFLLGLTATPLTTLQSFVDLLAQFTPRDKTPLTLADLNNRAVDVTQEMRRCGIKDVIVDKDVDDLARIMKGISIFYYSADRDTYDFPVFVDRKPKVIHIDIEADSQKHDMWSVQRTDGFVNNNGIMKLYHSHPSSRAMAIVMSSVPEIIRILNTERKKTAIFMPTKWMANNLAKLLTQQAKDFDYVVILENESTSEKLDKLIQDKKKCEFGTLGKNGVLISHKTFATGHTFDDSFKPTGKGIRRLISLQLSSLQATIQMEGRTRRRRSHAAYAKEDRDIERYVIIPQVVYAKSTPKPTTGCSKNKRNDCNDPCVWIKGGCKNPQAHNAMAIKLTPSTFTAAGKDGDFVWEIHQALLKAEQVHGAIDKARQALETAQKDLANHKKSYHGTDVDKTTKKHFDQVQKQLESKIKDTTKAMVKAEKEAEAAQNTRRTLWIFNDNEQDRRTSIQGGGNAQIRPYNAYGEYKNSPYAAGITTGSNGKGYSELSKHVKRIINDDLKEIERLIDTNNYSEVKYSSDGMGGLGTSIFVPSKDVTNYIMKELKKVVARKENRQTCEGLFHDSVKQQRDNYEKLLTALYRVSYGACAFRTRRPTFVTHVSECGESKPESPADNATGAGTTTSAKEHTGWVTAIIKRITTAMGNLRITE